MNPITTQSSVEGIEYYRSALITACCLLISLFSVVPMMAADEQTPLAPEKSSGQALRLDAARHELLGRLLKDLEAYKLPTVGLPKAPVRGKNSSKHPESPEPARGAVGAAEKKMPPAEMSNSNEPGVGQAGKAPPQAAETGVEQPVAVDEVNDLLLEEDLSDARLRIEQLRRMLQMLRDQRKEKADAPRTKPVRLVPAREQKIELPDVPPPAEPYGSEVEIGLLLVDMGRYQEALPHLDIGAKLDLDPEDQAWLQLRKAICLRRLGKLKQAQQVAQNLRLTWPDSHWASEAAWLIRSIKWLEKFNLNRPDVPSTEPAARPATGGQDRTHLPAGTEGRGLWD